jgi:hypothetical protein
MTPQEKCDNLINQYKPLVQFKMGVDQSYVLKMAKQCALISVEELIKVATFFNLGEELLYWEEVKQQIQN